MVPVMSVMSDDKLSQMKQLPKAREKHIRQD